MPKSVPGPKQGSEQLMTVTTGDSQMFYAESTCFSYFYQHLLNVHLTHGEECLNVIDLFNRLCLIPSSGTGYIYDYDEVKSRLYDLLPSSCKNLPKYNKLWDDMLADPSTFWRNFGRNAGSRLTETFMIPNFRGEIIENSYGNVASTIGDQCYDVLNHGGYINNLITHAKLGSNVFFCEYCGLPLRQLSNVSNNKSTKNLSAVCEHLLEALQLLLVYGLTPHKKFYKPDLLERIYTLLRQLKCYRYSCLHCNMVKSRVQTNQATSLFVQITNAGNGGFITENDYIKDFALNYFISNGNMYKEDYNLALYKLNPTSVDIKPEESQVKYMTDLLFGNTTTSITLMDGSFLTRVEVEDYYRNGSTDGTDVASATKNRISEAVNGMTHITSGTPGTTYGLGPYFIFDKVKKMVDELVGNLNSLIGPIWPNIRNLLSYGFAKIIARICIIRGTGIISRTQLVSTVGGSKHMFNKKYNILKGGGLNEQTLRFLTFVQNEDATPSMYRVTRSLIIIQRFMKRVIPEIKQKIIQKNKGEIESIIFNLSENYLIRLLLSFGYSQQEAYEILSKPDYKSIILTRLFKIELRDPELLPMSIYDIPIDIIDTETPSEEMENYTLVNNLYDSIANSPTQEQYIESILELKGLYDSNPHILLYLEYFKEMNIYRITNELGVPFFIPHTNPHYDDIDDQQLSVEEKVIQLRKDLKFDRLSLMYINNPSILQYFTLLQQLELFSNAILFPRDLYIEYLYSLYNLQNFEELSSIYDNDPSILQYFDEAPQQYLLRSYPKLFPRDLYIEYLYSLYELQKFRELGSIYLNNPSILQYFDEASQQYLLTSYPQLFPRIQTKTEIFMRDNPGAEMAILGGNPTCKKRRKTKRRRRRRNNKKRSRK